MSLGRMIFNIASEKLIEASYKGGNRLGGNVVLAREIKRFKAQLGDDGEAFARGAYDNFVKQMDAGKAAVKAVEAALEWKNPPPAPPVPDVHGSARWARISELSRAGLLGPPDELGRITPRIALGTVSVAENDTGQPDGKVHMEAFWSGEGPMLTFAPTRSGKGMSQVIPTLLRYPGSVLVMDPKGENYRLTAGYRHLQGSRIFKLDPFGMLEADHGETDAFNPIDYVKDEDDARTLALLLHPAVPPGHPGAKFYADEAINFLTAVILYVARSSPERTVGEVRRVTTLLPDDQKRFLEAMSVNEHPTIANEGALALQKSPDKRVELFRNLNTELAIWSNEGLRRATSRADFRFETLKEEITTIYVVVPFAKMEAFSSFLRVVFTTATNAMLHSQLNLRLPVLFMLDEFPSMGPQTKLMESISYLSGYDVRIWIFAQTLKQLADVYPGRWEDLVEQAAVKTFMDARGATAELVSRWMGLKTVAYETKSSGFSETVHDRGPFSFDKPTGSQSTSTGTAYTGRPLMTPDEVEQWFGRKLNDYPQLGTFTACFVNGQRPFATMRPYCFINPQLRAMVEKGMTHLAEVDLEALRRRAD